MKIKTSRFGELEVKPADHIVFEEGILGFEGLKKFFIVDPNDNTLILWMQSLEKPEVAFPILEPKIFHPKYNPTLLPKELTSLKLESLAGATLYSILTIPQDLTKMSANLKAPIVLNNDERIARQIVLQDNKLEVQHPMYESLKLHLHSLNANTASDEAPHSAEERKSPSPSA